MQPYCHEVTFSNHHFMKLELKSSCGQKRAKFFSGLQVRAPICGTDEAPNLFTTPYTCILFFSLIISQMSGIGSSDVAQSLNLY